MNIYLSNNLRLLRKERRLSQEELAHALGISRNKISSYEGKGIEPKLALLLKISEFFEVSVDDLVTVELTEDTLDEHRMAYAALKAASSQQTETLSLSQGTKAQIDTDLIRQFVANNERSYKMLEGFRSFYRLKSPNGVENSEVKNLMIILDHVLSVNKTFVHNLKNQLHQI